MKKLTLIEGRPGKYVIVRASTKNTRVAPESGGDSFLVATELLRPVDPTLALFPKTESPTLLPPTPSDSPVMTCLEDESHPIAVTAHPTNGTRIEFKNLWTKETESWYFVPGRTVAPDPRTRDDGVWFVRKTNPANKVPISLSYGDSHVPRYTVAEAYKDLRKIYDRFPNIPQDSLGVYCAPCIFSNSESHVLVDESGEPLNSTV